MYRAQGFEGPGGRVKTIKTLNPMDAVSGSGMRPIENRISNVQQGMSNVQVWKRCALLIIKNQIGRIPHLDIGYWNWTLDIVFWFYSAQQLYNCIAGCQVIRYARNLTYRIKWFQVHGSGLKALEPSNPGTLTLLPSQIGFLHIGVFKQIRRIAFEHHFTIFKYVTAPGKFECQARILFDQ